MSHSHTVNNQKSGKQFNDISDICGQKFDDTYGSDTYNKFDRLKCKRDGDARRRVEQLQEDLHLKALVNGERWF